MQFWNDYTESNKQHLEKMINRGLKSPTSNNNNPVIGLNSNDVPILKSDIDKSTTTKS